MKILKLVIFWLVLLTAGALLILIIGNFKDNGGLFFSLEPNSSILVRFLYLFVQWDGGNYYQISQSGYIYPHFFAYFPMYPGIIGVLSQIMPAILAGLGISLASLVGFLIVFSKMVKSGYPHVFGLHSLAVLSFPSAFILVCFYPESLFLVLTTLSSYLFVNKKDYFPSVIFAGLASVTRVQGIIFLLVVVIFLARAKLSLWQKFLLTTVSLIPLATLITMQKVYYGSYLGFAQAQVYWQRFTLPNIKLQFDYYGVIAIGNVIILFFTAILIIVYYRKLTKFDRIFLILTLILPLITGSLESFPRYLLSAYPFFILLALLLKSKAKIVLPIFIVLQAIFFSLFITGHWIF